MFIKSMATMVAAAALILGAPAAFAEQVGQDHSAHSSQAAAAGQPSAEQDADDNTAAVSESSSSAESSEQTVAMKSDQSGKKGMGCGMMKSKAGRGAKQVAANEHAGHGGADSGSDQAAGAQQGDEHAGHGGASGQQQSGGHSGHGGGKGGGCKMMKMMKMMKGGHSGSSPGAASSGPAGDDSASSVAFSAVSNKMHQNMSITYTGAADADYVKLMIVEHQAALDLAKLALAFGKDPEVRKLAESTVKVREAELEAYKKLAAKTPETPAQK